MDLAEGYRGTRWREVTGQRRNPAQETAHRAGLIADPYAERRKREQQKQESQQEEAAGMDNAVIDRSLGPALAIRVIGDSGRSLESYDGNRIRRWLRVGNLAGSMPLAIGLGLEVGLCRANLPFGLGDVLGRWSGRLVSMRKIVREIESQIFARLGIVVIGEGACERIMLGLLPGCGRD